jgi:hypothetical protein
MKWLAKYVKNLKIHFFDDETIGNVCIFSKNDKNYLTFHLFNKTEYWKYWGMDYEHYDGCYPCFYLGPFFTIAWYRHGYGKNCDKHAL